MLGEKKEHGDLRALLAADPRASALLDQVSQGAKERILARGECVGSLDVLEGWVHWALRGEGGDGGHL